MQVVSGDAIDVRKGLKTVRGFALTDFDTDAKDTKFELRLIGKKDAIGEVVQYNTNDCKVKAVSDEKYSPDPIEHNEEEESDAS